jgi:hypothetical protein
MTARGDVPDGPRLLLGLGLLPLAPANVGGDPGGVAVFPDREIQRLLLWMTLEEKTRASDATRRGVAFDKGYGLSY